MRSVALGGAALLLLLVATVIVLGGIALVGIVEFESLGGEVFPLSIGILLIVVGVWFVALAVLLEPILIA